MDPEKVYGCTKSNKTTILYECQSESKKHESCLGCMKWVREKVKPKQDVIDLCSVMDDSENHLVPLSPEPSPVHWPASLWDKYKYDRDLYEQGYSDIYLKKHRLVWFFYTSG